MKLIDLLAVFAILIASSSCKKIMNTLHPSTKPQDKKTILSEAQRHARQSAMCMKKNLVWDKTKEECVEEIVECKRRADEWEWRDGQCVSKRFQCEALGKLYVDQTCSSHDEICQQQGQVYYEGSCYSEEQHCKKNKLQNFIWNNELKVCEPIGFMEHCERGVELLIFQLMLKVGQSNCATILSESSTNGIDLYLQASDEKAGKINNIYPLVGLKNLSKLILTNHAVSDLSALPYIGQLKVLDLQNNKLDDLKGLESLTDLEELYLGHNHIKRIEALKPLSKLEKLDLQNNLISDISSLSLLTDLKELYLDSNVITDLRPLLVLKNITRLSIRNNPIIKDSTYCPHSEEAPTELAAFCKNYLNSP